jgi:hypothetical protein
MAAKSQQNGCRVNNNNNMKWGTLIGYHCSLCCFLFHRECALGIVRFSNNVGGQQAVMPGYDYSSVSISHFEIILSSVMILWHIQVDPLLGNDCKMMNVYQTTQCHIPQDNSAMC